MNLYKNEIILYLSSVFSLSYIEKILLFGSLARGKSNPNDCDVLIVITTSTFNNRWKEFNELIDGTKNAFIDKFGLPLNVLVNTNEEFEELNALKRRIINGTTIIIKK